MVRPEVPKKDFSRNSSCRLYMSPRVETESTSRLILLVPTLHMSPRDEFIPRAELRVRESTDTPRADSSRNSSCRFYMSPRVEFRVREATDTPRADS